MQMHKRRRGLILTVKLLQLFAHVLLLFTAFLQRRFPAGGSSGGQLQKDGGVLQGGVCNLRRELQAHRTRLLLRHASRFHSKLQGVSKSHVCSQTGLAIQLALPLPLM